MCRTGRSNILLLFSHRDSLDSSSTTVYLLPGGRHLLLVYCRVLYHVVYTRGKGHVPIHGDLPSDGFSSFRSMAFTHLPRPVPFLCLSLSLSLLSIRSVNDRVFIKAYSSATRHDGKRHRGGRTVSHRPECENEAQKHNNIKKEMSCLFLTK